jgi:hypothetical protein
VFFAQLAVVVLVWAATIAVLVRRRERLIDASRAQSRRRRGMEAIGLLLASIIVLALTMVVLAQGGMTKGGFTPFGWLVTTLAGAAFISLQTLALVPLVLNAVTPGSDSSSDRKESKPS